MTNEKGDTLPETALLVADPIQELRDRFAGLAMHALLSDPDFEPCALWRNENGETRLLGVGSNPGGPGWSLTETWQEHFGARCYNYADMLMNARERRSKQSNEK